MVGLLKLTKTDGSTILIGVESIISVQKINQNIGETVNKSIVGLTKIESRHAMVTHFIVKESVEDIYKMYKN